MLRRYQVDNSIEEKIITAMIVSTRFCKEITICYDKKYFTTPSAQVVSSWAMDYFASYNEAPREKIQDIFSLEGSKLKGEDAEIISAFLSKMSGQFEREEGFNADYYLDKAREYFKKQSLKQTTERAHALLETNQIEEAEKELEKRRQIYQVTGGWTNPFDVQAIKKFFADEAMKTNILFKLNGAVGDLLGPFERGWLVGVFAPAKRGKTFWLQEFGVHAALERFRTAIFSLEMGTHRIQKRVYRRVASAGDDDKKYVFPCFDCARNQDGSCKKPGRANSEKLLTLRGVKPVYEESLIYRPCTFCRGTKDFIPASWYTSMYREKLSRKNSFPKLAALGKMFRDNMRIQSYPAFSENLSRIRMDLDILEYTENFVPDVIIIDYADILAPEDSRVTGRERTDETWKALKNLADSRKCLVVTGSQTNRGSFEKKNVQATDASEDIRKIAHIDKGIVLNQLPEEKRAGVMRIAEIADRDDGFDQFRSAMVLQQLSLGQVNLDSEIVVERIPQKTKKKGEKDDDIDQEEV